MSHVTVGGIVKASSMPKHCFKIYADPDKIIFIKKLIVQCLEKNQYDVDVEHAYHDEKKGDDDLHV